MKRWSRKRPVARLRRVASAWGPNLCAAESGASKMTSCTMQALLNYQARELAPMSRWGDAACGKGLVTAYAVSRRGLAPRRSVIRSMRPL